MRRAEKLEQASCVRTETQQSRFGGLFGDASRFLAAGLVNTVLTLLIYQLSLFAMAAPLAYTMAWAVGLIFVALVYPDKVFRGGRRDRSVRLQVAATYAGIFLCGLLLLTALETFGLAPRLAIVVVLVATTGINFVLSRMILRR